jgi:hypothetical protein
MHRCSFRSCGVHGNTVRLEIRGRTDHALFEVRPDTNGNHVLRDLFTEAHPRIKSVRHDVGETVIVDDLDR